MSGTGRKSPLGSHGWILSSERRETAISGHSPTVAERLLNTESGHPEAVRDRRALTHSTASLDLPNRLELGPECSPGLILDSLVL